MVPKGSEYGRAARDFREWLEKLGNVRGVLFIGDALEAFEAEFAARASQSEEGDNDGK